MTETLASYTYGDARGAAIPLPERRTGSMGWLIDGAEVKVVNPVTLEQLPDGVEGVILVRGYFLTAGIVKHERSEVFTPDGFYNTGDKGYFLGDQLFLTGRVTEVIKTSGNNVAPPEVEVVLRSVPGVRLRTCSAFPTRSRRGRCRACVPTTGAFDADAIATTAANCSRTTRFHGSSSSPTKNDMPWLATGKPDRLRIRAMPGEAAAHTT